MERWQLYVWVFVSYFCAAVTREDWGYRDNGTEKWVRNYPDCGLDNQSPILLDSFKGTWVWPITMKTENVSVEFFDYTVPVDGIFSNTGQTVNLVFNNSDPERTARVVLKINGSIAVYRLKSMDFHWPSEHTFRGIESFALEMQMKHRDTEHNQSVILSYLFQECHEFTRVEEMDIITNQVRRLTNPGDQVPMADFVPQSVMPYSFWVPGHGEAACDYFAYLGSLTTPPCTEDVSWLVKAVPRCISRRQMEAFYEVLDKSGRPIVSNARPLQPTNNRTVLVVSCAERGPED